MIDSEAISLAWQMAKAKSEFVYNNALTKLQATHLFVLHGWMIESISLLHIFCVEEEES